MMKTTVRELCDEIDDNIVAVRKALKGIGVDGKRIRGDARSILLYLIDAGYDASWSFCDAFDVIVEQFGDAYTDDDKVLNRLWYVACKLFVMQQEAQGV